MTSHTAADIDAYLDQLDEPKRSTLMLLRMDILAVLPHAEQCLSYALPAFEVDRPLPAELVTKLIAIRLRQAPDTRSS
jgi:uncharacterized protein YdhG (YjbR/CyaY superfamily)